jgi:predicted ATPase/DNA-binding CsgD family transcriptional regulator
MARPASRRGNLPAETTSFIGRRRELAEVRAKLADARLVSLVGAGGVGKTRLAIRIAADLQRGFGDGGWLVELAEVLDQRLVSNAVMTALDLRDQAGTDPAVLVLRHLRDRESLLVLDNCEHLLSAVGAIVTDVLRTAPGVRVIATSREPLGVPGEHVVPVPPLELPVATEPVAGLRRNEAVRLFTQRAAAASGAFELTASNQAAVVGLCRRLDGLPLAIELAAVRTRVLSAEQILDRLSDRFTLLTGGTRAALPRHQTLSTTIEWSHDLLSDAERAVLRRSCVFAGRFTLDDVESVCVWAEPAPAGHALDVLSSLVDKSLVMKQEADGIACYHLHETMREFARLKLQAASEQEAAERRCAEYYLSTCAKSAVDGRYRLVEWLTWADLEIDNVRAVLQRCAVRADARRGTELATWLGWYWITRSTTEGMRWLAEFLAAGDSDQATRAWAHFMHGFLAVLKADPAIARPALGSAVAAARQTGQRELLSEALSMASIAENLAGDHEAAGQLIETAQSTITDLEYPPGDLAVLQARALNGFFVDDLGEVSSAASEGTRLARQTGDLYGLEVMLINLGCVKLLTADLDAARPVLTEALEIADRIDDRVGQFYLLDAFGCHAALSGRARLAGKLLGAADMVRHSAGANVMPSLTSARAQATESAVAAIGTARYDAEFEAGRQLSRDAAVSLALGRPSTGPVERRDRPSTSLLGPRQADVARLIADGLTNKEIGARLFISERTVDSHVRTIMNKLGCHSRAQIAAWMTGPDQ